MDTYQYYTGVMIEKLIAAEGLKLEAYRDAGRWAIGYGHTKTARAGMIITKAEAVRLLHQDLAEARKLLKRYESQRGYKLNSNQRAALTLFIYNVGSIAEDGTLDKAIRSGNVNQVANALRLYVFSRGEKLQSLVNRREVEARLYTAPNAALFFGLAFLYYFVRGSQR